MGTNLGFGIHFRQYDLPSAFRAATDHDEVLPDRVRDEMELALWQFGLDADAYEMNWDDRAVEIVGPALDRRLQTELERQLDPLLSDRPLRFVSHRKKVRDARQHGRRKQRQERAREREAAF